MINNRIMVADTDIPIPGTDESVNPSEPGSAFMTMLLLAVGSGVGLFLILDAGNVVRNQFGGFIARLTGVDMGNQSAGIEVE